MALTRANAETLLIRRLGKILAAVGLDGATVTGSNLDINDPLGYALREMGYSVANITAVADSDLSTLPEASYNEFLDIAELRLLESTAQNNTLVDLTLGPRKESYGQMMTALQTIIDRKTTAIQKQYGRLYSTISAGVIGLDFAEHDDLTSAVQGLE